ncbi:MAG: type IV toxin-antitoxin system AbiEi family antitoxin domain-containing protein [Lachnospiraceae bacterium]|nr:type IV toxin-antitoxin system AbiEi family antitoxin domain-containing protein [Lachnospiraceae bacterium]
MVDIEKITDTSGLLLTKEAIRCGVSKQRLYHFIKENQYEKVAHGIYASPEAWEDEAYILSLRCSQGVFSHDEALYLHDLIDREPIKRTITIYTGYGTSRLVKDGIKVFTVKKELLDVGKEYIVTSFGHKIPIYNKERTICDLVRSRSWFEIQDYQTAIKSYLKQKDKDLNRLMEYARLFHVDKKLREYMEVIL